MAILLDRTGLPVEIPTGPDLEAKRVAARRVDPWSPAYLAAQDKARALVVAMSTLERFDRMDAFNNDGRPRESSWRRLEGTSDD